MKKQIVFILMVTTLLFAACNDYPFDPPVTLLTPAPEPIITSFYPETLVGGEPMIIFGENFGASLTGNYVTLNGEYAQVTHVQHGGVVVRIPMNLPPGDYIIRLTVRDKIATALKTCTLIATE